MALFLSEHDVEQLVDMPTAIACIEQVHADHARGLAIDYPRQRVRTGSAIQHMLQGAWPEQGIMGYKVYTTSKVGNRFWLHLFDSKNGDPLAVMEANYLGMLRTGAASGVATRYLARADATRVGMIGAGWQAQGQLIALAQVRKLQTIQVYARNAERLNAFCKQMEARLNCEVRPTITREEALQDVDIIATVTAAVEPVLRNEDLTAGVHINAVGSNALIRRELDEKCVMRADLICVDSRETALREAGDLFPLLEKGRLRERGLTELGEIVACFRPARKDANQISLFESQGMAIQDLALAVEVLKRAREQNVGLELPIC